jgi:Xaa-Pro aminopeptidase
MNHKGRLRALLAALEHHNLDSLLVTHPPNIRYMCGFSGSAGVLVVGNRGIRLFTDGRYTVQAKEEVKGSGITVSQKMPLLTAADWLSKVSSGRETVRVGIDSEHLNVSSYNRLKKLLPKKFRLDPAPPLVEEARMVKDSDEIALLRNGSRLGADLFKTLLKRIRPGVPEREVAAALEFRAREKGAEAMSFETIIASGKRSAMPHGIASEMRIPGRGFVVCDFGVILTGYCSDMTRTVYMGRISEAARDFYRAVQEAQQAAIEAVRPGIQVSEVDRNARKVLETAGMGRYFTHSTGHGVGLEIHEAPRVASGQKQVLRPGMVITIEPGAYIPGRWGVRIEDMVVVTQQGCDVLTPTSKELISI